MARMRDKKKAKKTLFIPNLSGVEGRVTVPEGDYLVTVADIEQNEGNAADYYKWTLEIAEGEYKGKKLFYNTSLAEQALWNLRSLLESLGVDIEDDDMELDPDELQGRSLMVTVEHDSYEGKKQAKIVDFSMVGDAVAEESDDEADEEDEDPKAKKRRERRERRKQKKSESSDENEEWEEEEDEKNKKNKKNKKNEKNKKKSELDRDEIMDMSEDELVDLCEEHELDIDLDDYKTLRKKKAAVIDAAEEAELL